MIDDYDEHTADTRTRATDPGTSFEAAERIMPRLRELQQRVYECHKQNPQGLTDLELEMKLNGPGLSTLRTRRSELVELGLLADTGIRKVQNETRRIVWSLPVGGDG